MEWTVLLIPFTVGLYLHFYHKKEVLWWEAVLPALPVFIIIPLVKLSAESVLTMDTERHGGLVTHAEYYEDWDEYIHKTCTRKEDGKEVEYDCSYVDYHPPYWQVTDTNGYTERISKEDYAFLVKQFKNEIFKDLHRYYHYNDGDMYRTVSHNVSQPMTTVHNYTNRVQATTGVVGYPTVDDKGLYDYPRLDVLHDSPILGYGGNFENAEKYLQKANAELGATKQVRFWLLIFEGKQREIGFRQEAFWKGGNKNEIVVCVGTQGGKPTWCHTFCWSPDSYAGNDEMKIEIRDYVEQGDHDLLDISKCIVRKSTEKFKRKSFKEFSYLTVATPTWAYWLIWILTIGTTYVVGIFIMTNEHRSLNCENT